MSDYNGKEDQHWRDKGYHAEPAECSMAGRAKRDLFGFVDRVYVGPEGDVALVQITSRGNMQARYDKILYGYTGRAQWRIRMAEIARRLLNPTEPHGWIKIYVVGYELNEDTYRYERTQWEVDFDDLEAALRVST